MYGTSANYLRALTATATYSSRRCFAKSPARKIRGKALPQNAAYKRKELPPKLRSENVAMLTCESSAGGGICNVYLVGTTHDTPKSKREVKDVIQFLKPEVVFLELCPSRLTVLHTVEGRRTVQSGTLHEKPDETTAEKVTVFGDGAELSEFIEAYKQAVTYDAKVILGDRPIEITTKRMAGKISFWEFIKLNYYSKFQKERFAVFRDTVFYPHIGEILIHERDQYMSAKILEVAREHNSVVAVVGKRHLPGIQKNWKQPVELKRLLSVPVTIAMNPYARFATSVALTGLVLVFYSKTFSMK